MLTSTHDSAILLLLLLQVSIFIGSV